MVKKRLIRFSIRAICVALFAFCIVLFGVYKMYKPTLDAWQAMNWLSNHSIECEFEDGGMPERSWLGMPAIRLSRLVIEGKEIDEVAYNALSQVEFIRMLEFRNCTFSSNADCNGPVKIIGLGFRNCRFNLTMSGNIFQRTEIAMTTFGKCCYQRDRFDLYSRFRTGYIGISDLSLDSIKEWRELVDMKGPGTVLVVVPSYGEFVRLFMSEKSLKLPRHYTLLVSEENSSRSRFAKDLFAEEVVPPNN